MGDKWRLKPTEVKKSFWDLVYGVEYLKGKSYAHLIDSKKIAFFGASHGGLVGSVAINMKRDLFRSAILLNGNMDLIIDLPQKGRHWVNQYGNLRNKEHFNYLKQYNPLLNIKEPKKPEESYPITLIVASRNDEAVSITNSLKYLAHRREKAENNEFQKNKPTLMKLISSGGHNYRTAARTEYIDTVFAKLKFLAESIELKFDKKYQLKITSFAQMVNTFFQPPPNEYQIIEQREPKVITLHGETVSWELICIIRVVHKTYLRSLLLHHFTFSKGRKNEIVCRF